MGGFMSEATIAPTAAAPAPQIGRELPLEFRATGSEYFRIWIVNLFLTVLTLGIYYPWAKVRKLRYFYGSTLLDGSSFEFHGKAIAILKGYLIAIVAYGIFVLGAQVFFWLFLVTIPLFIFGMPWIIMKSRLFRMRMSSWRGLRFNFHGQYGGSLAAFILWPLLSVLTLFILWPFALWKQAQYLLSNGAYGSSMFTYKGTTGEFYKFCLIGVAILFGVMIAVAIAMGGVFPALMAAGPNADPSVFMNPGILGSLLVAGLVYAVGIMLLMAWFKANMWNATVGRTEVGPHQLYSKVRTWPLFGIMITNLLGMLCTLGLFYPWAKVRSLRYQLTQTGVMANGDLNQFVADNKANANAVGDAMSDVFDIDFGF
jgi:uncharacterized membrane protein YjgN (DUF898 family)